MYIYIYMFYIFIYASPIRPLERRLDMHYGDPACARNANSCKPRHCTLIWQYTQNSKHLAGSSEHGAVRFLFVGGLCRHKVEINPRPVWLVIAVAIKLLQGQNSIQCIYTYICIYVHIYTYIYIYILNS